MWPATFGLACCAIEMMSIVSSRYDIARFGMEAFRSSPRQADLLIVSGRVAQKMAAPLRQIYDQMLEPKWVIAMGACASSGGMFNNYTIAPGRGQDRAGRRLRAGLPAAAGGADGGDHPPARGACRPASRPRTRSAERRRTLSLERVPGCVERKEAHGETTLVVEHGAARRAAPHLRDELGFDFLSDITAADYLGWGDAGVVRLHRHAAAAATSTGRRRRAPARCPRRSRSGSRSTTTCSGRSPGAPACACRSWLDDGEPVPSVDRASGPRPTGTSARRGT